MAVPAEREGIGNGGSEYHRAEELGIRLSASTNGRPCVEQAELEQVQTIPEEASPTAGHERVEQRTHLRPIPGSILRNRESRCCSSTGPRVVKRVSMQFPTQHTQDGSNSSGSDDEHTLRVRPPTETIVELETESGEWKEKVEEMAGELHVHHILFCRMRPTNLYIPSPLSLYPLRCRRGRGRYLLSTPLGSQCTECEERFRPDGRMPAGNGIATPFVDNEEETLQHPLQQPQE